MSIDISNTLSVFIIAIALGTAGIFYFLQKPFALLVASISMMIAETIFGNTFFRVSIGSININAVDGLSALILITGGLRFFLIKNKKKSLKLFFLFILSGLGVLLIISWGRGLVLFGIETATNSFRPYFYFFSTLFFTTTLTVSPKLLNIFLKILGITGWMLIVIAIIRWGLVILGLAASKDWIAAGGLMTRVIGVAPTFALLQILLINHYTKSYFSTIPWKKLIPLVFLPIILILQHRTVWVSLLIAFIVGLLLYRKIRGIALVFLLFTGLAGSILLELSDFSTTNLSGTALDLHNFNWRVLGWSALLSPERYRTFIDYVIGQPFGTGYARFLPGWGEVTVSPHNFYIETFLNIGSIGLLILLTIYGIALTRLWRFKSYPINQAFLILLVTQLTFYITYTPNFEQGIILGMALVVATADKNTWDHQ